MKGFFRLVWTSWVMFWEPLVVLVKRLDRFCFGPCCDDPKLTWVNEVGIAVSTCSNCGSVKTYAASTF